MVRIADITEQNPGWSQGKDFVRYDPRLTRAKPIFFERKQTPLYQIFSFLGTGFLFFLNWFHDLFLLFL